MTICILDHPENYFGCLICITILKIMTEIHLNRNISKFHPNIIDNNEKYKIYMNKWKNLSLKRHEKFQN